MNKRSYIFSVQHAFDKANIGALADLLKRYSLILYDRQQRVSLSIPQLQTA